MGLFFFKFARCFLKSFLKDFFFSLPPIERVVIENKHNLVAPESERVSLKFEAFVHLRH